MQLINDLLRSSNLLETMPCKMDNFGTVQTLDSWSDDRAISRFAGLVPIALLALGAL